MRTARQASGQRAKSRELDGVSYAAWRDFLWTAGFAFFVLFVLCALWADPLRDSRLCRSRSIKSTTWPDAGASDAGRRSSLPFIRALISFMRLSRYSSVYFAGSQ